MNKDYDVIIVGGGPAALAAAVYTCRALLKTVIFEKKYLGGQLVGTELIENYPGFPEVISGVDLTQRMEAQAKRFGAEIRYEEVLKLGIENGLKIVTTDANTYASHAVILAAGADPKKLDVPGEKEFYGKGVSYCATCDGAFFRDKDVVVIGGGDSAITEGIFLTKYAKTVQIIHRRNEFRATKIYLDEAFSNPKIKVTLDTVIESIHGTEKVEGVVTQNVLTKEKKDIPCQGVFIFVGSVPNTGFLGNLLCVDTGCHIETNIHMETAIEGLYAVGDIRKNSYRQIATAVGEGVTAAIASEHKLAELKALSKVKK
ncbi:MAG: thioredoxin-disulfide reductase [Candidatus Brocadia sp. AMX2]|uniref:Thioredoxin reductase n=1 Tax=Candidatus Brocadia sinica JPN1 TaxID=1197129 RepID=A0ABQ0JXU1_9BACT|nr:MULTISPECIES: thioredoxin-disulfide reductase [Brocadia]MBC6932626.1 thioredoxin-disulfide reductase [Candidatus Brocadia sp.]MBL1169910.1 thioredoxin-disulfide reductase [Candidatus Brocadia sp. AMX1]GIK13368.1 MAG: thioredoxin reductase [Candidatus Brocadia sinica]KAA0244758.1 MAG: thioredoxin-disulfide reductase [Candidatus Brocadia sp. AMX2]MCE7867070.1 thioredoxin-disulfide reductase [Candidatus Brocadia sp. AMX2]